MREVTIRDAVEADYESLKALHEQLHENDPTFGPAHRRVFAQILESPWLRLFVLEAVDGSLMASCYLNIIPNLSRGAAPYGVIENVITCQSSRRRGYGKAVMTHAIEVAWVVGCYKVMLMTGSKRENTHSFYRACGFSGEEKTAYIMRAPGSV
ncbi:MAG: GNAT family N-acetyltransferase [Pseudomonadota bacterium]